MKRGSSIGAVAAVTAALALVAAGGAGASSLPRVSSGERPGPPLLYERPPVAPELSVGAPFRADPLLVSGTDAYRGGEYLYQDYLFDDRGADTVEAGGQRDSGASFSPTAGNVFYPKADRFAQNAADLVELRIKPTPGAILYRVTLNTVKADDAAIVGIGIDTDRSGGAQVDWPGGAGVSSPGLDRFITAWGTGAKVFRRNPATGQFVDDGTLDADDVTISRRTNQMTIRVPRDDMNPGRKTWRYVAGAGLRAAGNNFKQVLQGPPSETEPGSGDPTEGAPGVFNLAFRFDEPLSSTPKPEYGPNVGIGNWFETKQADRLKRASPGSTPTTGGFRADVSFARLGDGANADIHAPRQNQARIMSSAQDVHEGFRDRFPSYGGRLQPYLLRVPAGGASGPRGLTFSLHSLGATYTQYAVFSPKQLVQFGDQRDNLVATPLGRGPNGWYMNEGEVDFFEVWRDIAKNFSLDSERVALTGYSMGGYGTYRLGVLYPDLFGRAFTTVGPPARGGWVPPAPPFDPDLGRPTQDTNSNPLLENVRWVPFMNWVALMDDLVPYAGPRKQQRRFDGLGLRSQLWTFSPAEHFTLAILDEWAAARNFLGSSRVKRAPSRVSYALMPDTQRADLGLVQNHAYWVSDLRARDRSGDPRTNPARAEINAISRAFGESEDPTTAPVVSASPGPPEPSTVEGTRWTAIPSRPRTNALHLQLENLSRATIDGRRARLDGSHRIRVRIDSDGDGTARLNLPLPAGAEYDQIEGGPVPGSAPQVTLDRRGATFRVSEGSRAYYIEVGR